MRLPGSFHLCSQEGKLLFRLWYLVTNTLKQNGLRYSSFLDTWGGGAQRSHRIRYLIGDREESEGKRRENEDFLCAICIFVDQILQLSHIMTMTCYVCTRTLVLLIEQTLWLFTQACTSNFFPPFPVIPHQSLPEEFLVLVQLPHYLWLQL